MSCTDLLMSMKSKPSSFCALLLSKCGICTIKATYICTLNACLGGLVQEYCCRKIACITKSRIEACHIYSFTLDKGLSAGNVADNLWRECSTLPTVQLISPRSNTFIPRQVTANQITCKDMQQIACMSRLPGTPEQCDPGIITQSTCLNSPMVRPTNKNLDWSQKGHETHVCLHIYIKESVYIAISKV